jgi:hypothetical protein
MALGLWGRRNRRTLLTDPIASDSTAAKPLGCVVHIPACQPHQGRRRQRYLTDSMFRRLLLVFFATTSWLARAFEIRCSLSPELVVGE